MTEQRGGEPFELVVEGVLPTDPTEAADKIAALEDAGVTWWIDSNWDFDTVTPDGLLERIRRGPVLTATVADCERVQLSWFQLRAQVLGGEAWEDDGLVWANGDLMFPQVIDPAALARGVERARAQGPRPSARGSGSTSTRPRWPPPGSSAAGSRGGWPGPPDLGGIPADARVELQETTTDYRGMHAGYAAELAMARLRPARAWYAAAYDEGRFAGRAWSHRVGDLAGVFDVDVWQPFQRRGLGTGLMQAVCSAAAGAGAGTVVLNSTPAASGSTRSAVWSASGRASRGGCTCRSAPDRLSVRHTLCRDEGAPC